MAFFVEFHDFFSGFPAHTGEQWWRDGLEVRGVYEYVETLVA